MKRDYKTLTFAVVAAGHLGPTVAAILAMRPRRGASWAADRIGCNFMLSRTRNQETGRMRLTAVYLWHTRPGLPQETLWNEGLTKRPNWPAIRDYLYSLAGNENQPNERGPK